jgi:nucleotide-binding universal stress UspA family protein
MKIVVGYDGSGCADAALEVAVNTAKELGDDLVLVFAYEPPGRVGEEFKAYRKALEERGEKLLEKAAKEVRKENVPVETRLVAERPSEALADVAENEHARFLVVGTYGESPLRSAILGSVPHKLLQISRVPVLCVRED